jgi:hypothetical protein
VSTIFPSLCKCCCQCTSFSSQCKMIRLVLEGKLACIIFPSWFASLVLEEKLSSTSFLSWCNVVVGNMLVLMLEGKIT